MTKKILRTKYTVTAKFPLVLLLLTKEEQSAIVLQNDLIAVTEVMFFY